jgi:beta-carotene 3-hydroxylase
MLERALAFAAGFAAMEAIAWAAHRFLMHGPLWPVHRSHHEPRSLGPQPNDLFGLLFAGVAVALFAAGAALAELVLWWGAAGVTFYGGVYALIHDGLIHGRFGLRPVHARGPLRRIVQAHRLHHAVRGKEGCVAFGLLWPGDVGAHVRRLRRAR